MATLAELREKRERWERIWDALPAGDPEHHYVWYAERLFRARERHYDAFQGIYWAAWKALTR